MHAAKIFNREVGTFRTAYVVGTLPLAFAFLDEAPDLDAYKKLSEPEPWPPPEGTRGVKVLRWPNGNISDVADYREREPRLVADAALAAEANVVLRYPEEMALERGERLMVGVQDTIVHARLVVLPRPVTLSSLIDGVVNTQALIRDAQIVVEVPVR